jgi:hypothetical protein
MSAPDPSTPDHTPSAFPSPVAGAGSADLSTDSTDPEELRALLERARERLSFYESFDKIIAENLRRTGEMMAETVALREQAALEMRKRQEADAAIEVERQRYRALLEGALSEVRTAQPVIDAMVTRLQGALDELGNDTVEASPEPHAPATTVDAPETTTIPEPEPERLTPDVPEVAAPEQPETPITEEPPVESAKPDVVETVTEPAAVQEVLPSIIEILAHGVPSAATAIGLQQMLREIDVISRVEAREFADGELRLHLECSGTIPDESFTDWLAHNSGSLVSRNAKAIELSFS